MLRSVYATTKSVGTTIVRLVLGIVFFAHGSQLMLGWFGGYGLQRSIHFFSGALHIPPALAFLAISAEFFGGLALIAGLATRIAAIGIGVDMLVALLMVHRQFGFFMNWFGAQKGEGYEYHLLAISIATFLMIEGAGALSIDRLLAGKWSDRQNP